MAGLVKALLGYMLLLVGALHAKSAASADNDGHCNTWAADRRFAWCVEALQVWTVMLHCCHYKLMGPVCVPFGQALFSTACAACADVQYSFWVPAPHLSLLLHRCGPTSPVSHSGVSGCTPVDSWRIVPVPGCNTFFALHLL
jgi:hypothetical protein